MFSLFKRSRSEENITIGFEDGNDKPIVLNNKNQLGHELVLGKPGSGKSKAHLLRRLTYDLMSFSRDKKQSIVVIEKKGTLLDGVKRQMNQLSINPSQVVILDGSRRELSNGWNPLFEENAEEIIPSAIISCLSHINEFERKKLADDLSWLVNLSKMFFKDKAYLTDFYEMYINRKYLKSILRQISLRNEESQVTDYDYYLYNQITPNKEVVKILNELLCDKKVSRILCSNSSFRIKDILSENKIVLVNTSYSISGKILGNLFLEAFSRELYNRHDSEDRACCLTIDDTSTFEITSIEMLLSLGCYLNLSIRLSY